MTLPIEEQFIDHSPQTEQGKKLREQCNGLASEFALFIAFNLKDETTKNLALQTLQTIRLIVNHGFEIDELNFIEEYNQRVGVEPEIEQDVWDDDPVTEKKDYGLSSKIKRHVNKSKKPIEK